ncbi:DUF262 domain-containing protein [Acinetobacter towneri]|uniref:DUF262 domain-containing protein n=2 Tax=Acinetobacter towneri TaxID=202956 RepID=UPI00209AB8C9|nr:DUF262 domain-containing protein [Acinetobacter towneri]MCO8055286.1 DUF262 domain-containing HNH endonuclease family protein [Acinetobacter towneri]
MKVSQEPVKLSDVLKDKAFIVPLYQREYSWTLDQVSDLFYDLLDSDEKNGHFFGSLLIYDDKNREKMEVIDGQQRLTTLFILLFSILKKLEGTEKNKAINVINKLLFIIDPHSLSDDITLSEPRLETGKRDKILFKSIIKGEDFSKYRDGRRKSHKNLNNTLDFFNAKLEEIIKNKGLDGLIYFAEKVIKSEFIIMTAENSVDRLMFFKIINTRGLNLAESDLIKNEVCHNLTDEKEMEEAITIWDEIRTKIENNNGSFDNFLFHYVNSIKESFELRKDRDIKKGISHSIKLTYPPVPERLVFEIYSDLIKKKSSKDFLGELQEACNEYINFINPSNDKTYLKSFKDMGVTKCYPLLLASKKQLGTEDFEKICKGIESLTFRHSILRKDPKELEAFYYKQIETINSETPDKVSIVLTNIKEHNNFKDEDRFKSEFVYASPKSSVSRMILDRIVKLSSEGVDWTNKDVHIEHIMPQTPANQWKEMYDADENEYKDYLNRLGNLTILLDKANIKARNKNFSDKKDYYNKSRLYITNSLAKYDNWNYEQIEKRQEQLYELAKNIWKV